MAARRHQPAGRRPKARPQLKPKRKAPPAPPRRGPPPKGKRRGAAAFVEASRAPREGIGAEGAALGHAPATVAPGIGTRLNRWLAEQGVDSRRHCDAMVLEGSVSVNGEVLREPGYRVQPGDDVRVNGARVKEVRRLYYAFHKPRGVLCTNDQRERRTRVCDLVDPLTPSRVYPIGRLDEDSEGLLLLTNDGDFAQLVAHPRYGVAKTYYCTVGEAVEPALLARVRRGAFLDGARVAPENVRIVKNTPSGATLEVTIREGRNREVRRMLARHGLGVKRLKRVRIGALGLRGLKRGELRPLTREERDALVAEART